MGCLMLGGGIEHLLTCFTLVSVFLWPTVVLRSWDPALFILFCD